MSRRETEILRLLGEGNLDPNVVSELIDELNDIEFRRQKIKTTEEKD